MSELEVTEPRRSMMREFWAFVWENKIWWITPTVLILGLLVVVILLTSGSAITPFFYALF
jgi:hypothetical protein